jgi:hypothetical protein
MSKPFIPPSKSNSLTSNPSSILSVPLCRFYQPVNQFLNESNSSPNLLLPHLNRPYLSSPIFLKNFPYPGVKQATLCQFCSRGDSSSERAHALLVTREWRFHFAESLPVPINGSNLQTQVMANPLSMYHASRLCLPLPGLTGTLPPMKNL